MAVLTSGKAKILKRGEFAKRGDTAVQQSTCFLVQRNPSALVPVPYSRHQKDATYTFITTNL